jgi:hypothetical protein
MNPESANIPDLIRQLRDDSTVLLREELNLAKTEIKENVTNAARNGTYLASGGLVCYAGLVTILIGVGFLLRQLFVNRGWEEGTATFLGLLITGIVTGAVGGILINKALHAFKCDSLTPERTARSLREDKQWAQSKLSS